VIKYNPKDWLNLIFAFHRSDTFRVLLPAMLGVAIFTILVEIVLIDLVDLRYKGSYAVHSLLGFVISLLLVFRTNTAYERWWEGRKLWGNMVNNSRNLAMELNAYLPENEKNDREDLWLLISNYVLSAKEHLRNSSALLQLTTNERHPLSAFTGTSHLPARILSRLYDLVSKMYREKRINDYEFLNLNHELQEFTNIIGACERIKNTPIPYAYSIFIKKFIFIYVMTMPFAFVSDFGYWAIPIVVFVFYVLSSLELIAEEIEDPFGRDDNDLSTDELCVTISKNTREILQLDQAS
jgi:putative membrane protein